MRRTGSARTASTGVAQTQLAVVKDLGWVFRGQLFEDYGVDALVEVADDGGVLGLLLGLQIKGGQSQFRSPADDGWWFSEDTTHFVYWLGFSIPIAIVLADLESQLCYWELVTESTVVKSGGSRWKIRVPRSHVLDRSAVGPLRAAAEAGDRRARDRRPVGAPVTEFDPAELEVHAAFPGAGAYAEMPPEYFTRPHDQLLDELVERAFQEKSGLAVLVGPSAAGKTRALYEALHRPVRADPAAASLAQAEWRVWPTVNPLPPRRFLDELALVGPRTVVWLNEAQRYLRDPSAELRADIATGLRELLADDSRGPVLVLGTLWREHWNEITRKPDSTEIDQFAAVRRLLEGSYVRVPATFTNAEVSAARRSGDERVAVAASQVTGAGVTQYLAGAPDLVQRYETADETQRAVIHAAMDARRLGHREWFSASFLRDAARCYLTGSDRDRADDDPSWFDAAVEDLLVSGKASGPVLRQNLFGYRLDDILDQDGRARRRFEFPPAEFWSVVAEGDVAPDSRVRLADGAASRMRLQIAAQLYDMVGTRDAGNRMHELAMHCERGGAPHAADRLVQRAAAAGSPEALTSLANWRRAHGDESDPSVVRLLRQAADLGDIEALDPLAWLLECAGDKEGAEAVARKAVGLGSWEATASVAEWRDIDYPAEAEQLVYNLPVEMRSAALAHLVDSREGANNPDRAERLALSAATDGDEEVLLTLAEQRAEGGKKASARRLLEHITRPDTAEDMLRLALIHARAGDHAQARTLVETAVDASTGLAPSRSGFEGLGERLALFVDMRPQAVDRLAEVLTVLDERDLSRQLHDAYNALQPPWREMLAQLDMSEPSDEDEEPPDETDDEVGWAYVTLSGFHAKRGEFQEAESFALQAAAAGTSAGLEVLGRELLQNGDREAAERLALCAVNMTEASFLADSSWTALAEARADDTLLVSGLDADGATAAPW